MADQPVSRDDIMGMRLPELQIPVANEISPEELARRQRVVARIHKLRKSIGSIGITSDDLLHESRQEDERRVNGWFSDK